MPHSDATRPTKVAPARPISTNALSNNLTNDRKLLRRLARYAVFPSAGTLCVFDLWKAAV